VFFFIRANRFMDTSTFTRAQNEKETDYARKDARNVTNNATAAQGRSALDTLQIGFPV